MRFSIFCHLAEVKGSHLNIFGKGEAGAREEFAIDLCSDSTPSQVVAARIKPQPTLAADLAHVESESARTRELAKTLDPYELRQLHSLTPGDKVLVPDLHWFVSHRFRQLERGLITNGRLGRQPLGPCQQDIFLRLNRLGAELRSEATGTASSGLPNCFFLDRPFLIYMRKRGEKLPYFVTWVDNAELLQPWPAGGERH